MVEVLLGGRVQLGVSEYFLSSGKNLYFIYKVETDGRGGEQSLGKNRRFRLEKSVAQECKHQRLSWQWEKYSKYQRHRVGILGRGGGRKGMERFLQKLLENFTVLTDRRCLTASN